MVLSGLKLYITDPSLRHFQTRLRAWKNLYAGRRCFIMGNGPSLNETPLNLLQNDLVWGFNRCYLLFDRISWRPAFYSAVDTRVVPDNADEIKWMIREYPEMNFFFPSRVRFQTSVPSAQNVFWYREKLLKYRSTNPHGYFSTIPDKYVYSVRTVTIAALQLAAYMGFNPIFLIGCDTNYRIPDTVTYEDEMKYSIVSNEDNDPNHFSPTYFGVGKKYHQPYPEKMIAHYQMAKQVCDQYNIQVFNATVGGKLEVFPRVEIQDLF